MYIKLNFINLEISLILGDLPNNLEILNSLIEEEI